MLPQVVDASDGDLHGGAAEVGDREAGHLKTAQDPADRMHDLIRCDVHGGSTDATVEDHVQVLVRRHPLEQLVGDRLVTGPSGIAVRHPRRKLLERHVDQGVEHRLRSDSSLSLLARAEPGGHLLHPGLLQVDRIHGPGDDEVVAQRHAVPVFLHGPAVHPRTPGVVEGEVLCDGTVVGGQVVLGEQIGDHGDPGHLAQRGLFDVPVPSAEGAEVCARRPRHVVMRVPVLGGGEVLVEPRLGNRFEFVEQFQVRQWPCRLPCHVARHLPPSASRGHDRRATAGVSS
jgi:hypothetical protein